MVGRREKTLQRTKLDRLLVRGLIPNATMQTEDRNNEQPDWLAVIARSLAFICLDKANLRQESLGEQATFLQNLGLPRKDAAKILNTSDDSLRVLANVAKKKKGGNRAKRK